MNLATKIILSLLGIIILLLGGFTYLILEWQRTQLEKSTHHYSRLLGEAVCDSIATEMESGRSDKVQEILERIGKGSSYIHSLHIFAPEGNILRSANPSEVGRELDPLSLGNHLKHLSNPFEHEIERERYISFIKPFPNEPRCQKCHPFKQPVIGFLDLDISLKPMEELISSSEKFLLGSVAVALFILAGSIGFVGSRWINKPLSKVMDGMRRVESGDLGAKVSTTSRDELGRVAQTFNSMVESLRDAKRDLEIMHQRELERSQRMATLGEMASAMAHEIRNPLTGIANATRMIRREFDDTDPRAAIFDEVNHQTKRLGRIVSNLVQYAQTSSPQLSSVDLHAIIDKVLALFSHEIQNQEIDIGKEFQSNMVPVSADPDQVQQALTNIVQNSIQAMPKGGTLQCKTLFQSEDQMVHLIISDTGAGIKEEIIPEVFKPFFSTKARGAGLGLAIVEKIVQGHGGNVFVSSKVGMGTSVEICLPISHGDVNEP